MSAGNAGPNNGTSDHPSDDYISVAASQSGGTLASGRLGVTAPTPVDPNLADIAFASAAFGSTLAPGALYPYNFLPANSVDPTNVQGCNAWPAGTFTDKAALIMRGTCEFGVKVLNAENAGAIFVIVYNNAAGGDALINMGPGAVGGAVMIPSVFIGNTKGTLMDAWYVTNGAASEVTVDTFAFHTSNTPDVIASFSSRGPGVGNVLKPDITAPGVNILAQGYTPGATGEARHLGWGQASGTSMASPHVAGAAVLIRQIHPDWSNAAIKSALMTTSKFVGIWNGDGTHAQPLDMGAGRLDLTNAADPGVILDPPSVSGGLIVTGETKTIYVNVTNVAAAAETYNLSAASVTGTYPTPTIGALPGFSVSPAEITLAPGETTLITVTFDSSLGAIGDNQGFIVLDGSIHDAHMPAWVRVSPVSTADVLVIDNDASSSLGYDDYASYYTDALDTLGMTYDVLDTDVSAGAAANFLPEAATLSSYKAVIYFTGDNYLPNGSFTVPTPLTARDMDRLTEYANSGGIVIAMGQDLASVLNSTSSNSASFFYSSVLGGSYLQDSVTGFNLPVLPVTADVNGPAALQGVMVNLNGVTGDGAHNQAYIDELSPAPNLDPNPIGDHYNYTPLLQYAGPNNLDRGTVAIAHRDQPNLEVPGTDYLGRSIYTTFGLEGVNNGLDGISRSDLLKAFFDWAVDVPTASISDTTFANASNLTMFQATMTSNLAGVVPETYRWDFGDGSAFTPAFESADVSHVYAVCGNYTVRVEMTDSWGNKAIGTYQAVVSECTTHVIYMPVMMIDATIP
jgi:subtilisin family serine protease